MEIAYQGLPKFPETDKKNLLRAHIDRGMTLNGFPIRATSLYCVKNGSSNFYVGEVSRNEIRSRNKDAAFKSTRKKVT